MSPRTELADLLPIAREAVSRASKLFRGRSPGVVTVKSDRNPATEVDFAIERAVRRFLLAEVPEIGFMGEEDGTFGATSSGLMWVLDPLDGTVNFIHGLPLCGISLGLLEGAEPVLGVIELPFLGMQYTGHKDGGAFRDDERIAVATTRRLADAVVAVGDYAVGHDAARKNYDRLRVTQALAARAQRVRMFGSAAMDLAWVADGRIGAAVMLTNKPWDTAAGVLLAREAGALVIDRGGMPYTTHSSSTVAVVPALVHELLEILRE
jgi:myo-inositol-1(or 4)-monophosphatase